VAAVAGSVTLVVSLVGLTLGRLAASKIPIRTDLLGGVVMLILACAIVVRA
jgi:putative Mn2+ efflux pump MntP